MVGIAIVGTALCFVGAHPSSDTTSANSGLFAIMPTAFAVSMEEPPPIATMKSAPALRNASRPLFTFAVVGLGFMSEKIS